MAWKLMDRPLDSARDELPLPVRHAAALRHLDELTRRLRVPARRRHERSHDERGSTPWLT
jgi:hypothetical protein